VFDTEAADDDDKKKGGARSRPPAALIARPRIYLYGRASLIRKRGK